LARLDLFKDLWAKSSHSDNQLEVQAHGLCAKLLCRLVNSPIEPIEELFELESDIFGFCLRLWVLHQRLTPYDNVKYADHDCAQVILFLCFE